MLSACADAADAIRETMLALGLYVDVAGEIAAMPVVAGGKTAGERFPGTRQTFTVEGMMRDDRALQAGTSHYLGTNFPRAFGIQYTAESGELEETDLRLGVLTRPGVPDWAGATPRSPVLAFGRELRVRVQVPRHPLR